MSQRECVEERKGGWLAGWLARRHGKMATLHTRALLARYDDVRTVFTSRTFEYLLYYSLDTLFSLVL